MGVPAVHFAPAGGGAKAPVAAPGAGGRAEGATRARSDSGQAARAAAASGTTLRTAAKGEAGRRHSSATRPRARSSDVVVVADAAEAATEDGAPPVVEAEYADDVTDESDEADDMLP